MAIARAIATPLLLAAGKLLGIGRRTVGQADAGQEPHGPLVGVVPW